MTLSSDIESEKEEVCRPRHMYHRDSYLPDTGQTVKTRTIVCCASFVTTMNKFFFLFVSGHFLFKVKFFFLFFSEHCGIFYHT